MILPKIPLERLLNYATIVVAALSLIFVITNHFHLWDKWRGVTLLEEASQSFNLSYAPNASAPIYPNNPEWTPLINLIKRYSNVKLLPNKDPKVIARFQAISSGQVEDGPGQYAEWTAPGTPLAILYVAWPGNSAGPGDYQVIGTIGDLQNWIIQDQNDFSFLINDIILGTLSFLIGLLGIIKIKKGLS
ncbi:MAG TPA: hypothetical protein VHZ04_00485 [Candidatus Paceibacterota bacterium]|jgi:hypothetical protein|nr:hypothetical protein [Candidatus Paceibacterota bacterium]